jgi:hypothetical protein
MIEVQKPKAPSGKWKYVVGSIVGALSIGLGGLHLWLSSNAFSRSHVIPVMAKALGMQVTATGGRLELSRGKVIFAIDGATIAWFRTLVLRDCSLRLAGQPPPVTGAEIRLRFPISGCLAPSPRPEYVRVNKASLAVRVTNGVSNIGPLLEALRAEFRPDGSNRLEAPIKLCEIKDCSVWIHRTNWFNSNDYSYNDVRSTFDLALTNFTPSSWTASLNASETLQFLGLGPQPPGSRSNK